MIPAMKALRSQNVTVTDHATVIGIGIEIEKETGIETVKEIEKGTGKETGKEITTAT
jgi:hypothetical protein